MVYVLYCVHADDINIRVINPIGEYFSCELVDFIILIKHDQRVEYMYTVH